MEKVQVAGYNKSSKKVQLTNTKTGLVLVLNSLNEIARYLQTLSPEYNKAEAGTFTSNTKKGSLYKDVFKVKYLEDNYQKIGVAGLATVGIPGTRRKYSTEVKELTSILVRRK